MWMFRMFNQFPDDSSDEDETPQQFVPERERMPYSGGAENSDDIPHQAVPERSRMPYSTGANTTEKTPQQAVPERSRMPYSSCAGNADEAQHQYVPERSRMPYCTGSRSSGRNSVRIEPEEKKLDKLLDQLVEMNNNNVHTVNIDRTLLEQKMAMVKQFIKETSGWTESRISTWAKNVRAEQAYSIESMPKFIAVACRANFLAMGIVPRDAQIIALLMLLLRGKDFGRLLEKGTGEGKSTVAALQSVILALRGPDQRCDVITSSPVLARRDASDKKRRNFYAMLGLSVSHNTISPQDHPRDKPYPCYAADIVFGDVSSFQGDTLRQNFKGRKTRGTRPFSSVIVDEVDSMLIDENTAGKILMLSHQVPQMEYLQGLLVAGWKQWQQLLFIRSKCKYNTAQRCYELRGQDTDGTEIVKSIDDPGKFFRNLLEEWFRGSIQNPTEAGIAIPTFLREHALSQVQNWAISAETASAMNEGEEYVIRKKNGRKVVMPFDGDTGIVQSNMHWSDGLHEFLQIKHNLSLSKETLTTCFSSNLGYYQFYGSEIYGFTGTLGSPAAQHFLKKLYPMVELALIPGYKSKQFREMEGILSQGRTAWKQMIAKQTAQMLKSHNRPVLVVMESINDITEMYTHMRASLPAGANIRRYDDPEQSLAVDEPLGPNDVILATNLAGRGTDIKITKAAEQNGGLHVIVTFLPDNLRIQMQAYGRAARQGQPGTGQLIIDRSELNGAQARASTISDVIELRDKAESEKFGRSLREQVPRMRAKEALFQEFMNAIVKIREQYKDKEYEHSYLLNQIEESWGFWLRKNFKEREKSELSVQNQAKLLIELRQNFIANVQMNCPQNAVGIERKYDVLFDNPSYMVLTARYHINHGSVYRAMKLLDTAIAKDPTFAFAAYYYRGLANVQKSHSRFMEEKKRDSQVLAFDRAAMEDFRAAHKLIEEEIIPRLSGLQVIAKVGDEQNEQRLDSPLSLQQQAKIDLLRKQQQYIDKAIAIIEKCPSGRGVKLLNYVDPEKIYPEGTPIPKEEIDELGQFGVMEFFELGYATPPRPWFAIIALALIGVAQIAVGAVCASFGHITFGKQMIMNGIGDIKKAIEVAMGESTLDWKNWWIKKALDYGMALLGSLGRYIAKKCPKLQKIIDWFGKKEEAKAVKCSPKEIVRDCFKTEIVQEVKGRVIEAATKYIPFFDDVRKMLRGSLQELLNEQFGGNSTLGTKLVNLLKVGGEFVKMVIREAAKFLTEMVALLQNFCNKLLDKIKSLSNNTVVNIICSIVGAYFNEIGLPEIVKKFCEKIEKYLDGLIDKCLHKASDIIQQGMDYVPTCVANDLEERLQRSGILQGAKVWTENSAAKLKNTFLGSHEALRSDLRQVLQQMDEMHAQKADEKCAVIEDMQNLLFSSLNNIMDNNGSFNASPGDIVKLASTFSRMKFA